MVTGSSDSVLRLYDARRDDEAGKASHLAVVSAVARHRDRPTVLHANVDLHCQDRGRINGVAFSPDGEC